MQHRLSLPFREAFEAVSAVTSLAKVDKHTSTAGRALLTYLDPQQMEAISGVPEGRLFFRADGPLCMLQLRVPCEVLNVPSGWRAAIQVSKLLSAVKFVKKSKPASLSINVLKTGLRIGKITIKAEDHMVFGTPSRGITKTRVLGKTVNPYNAVVRAEHCVGEEAVPSIAILGGQILSARNNQAITVDCEVISPMEQERLMVPIKDLLRVKDLGDTVEVRLSDTYLVFASDQGILAVRKQRWSHIMDDALHLFESASFVDEAEVDREELLTALKTAKDILGAGANAMLAFSNEGGSLRSSLEGDEVSFDFDCKVRSGKRYTLGLVVRMLLDAVTHAPEPQVVFKIPDMDDGPCNMIHLVDSGSHEVIGLGVTCQLREDGIEETTKGLEATDVAGSVREPSPEDGQAPL